MNIVKPYARIVRFEEFSSALQDDLSPILIFNERHGVGLLRKCEWIGRISHRSEDAQTQDSWRRFLQAVVIQHGDWSIMEHASVTVDFLVDRGITHELVRHRLFSFTQESTRFVNYEKKMPASFIQPIGLDNRQDDVWRLAVSHCEHGYLEMIRNGCSPQIARSVFPNALASRILVTGNLRNWRHFLLMRTTKETHPQMREVTIPLLAEFKEKIPITFDDIEPMMQQSENLKKGR